MKTFDEIYEELQSEDNGEFKEILEEGRAETAKKNKIALVLCLIIDAIILKFAFSMRIIFQAGAIMFLQPLMTMFVADFMIYVILSAIFSKTHKKYVKMYKEIKIKKLMNNFYGNLEYFPQKQMPKYIYEEPKYIGDYNRYSSDDYMEAVLNDKYSIQMAEVKTEKVERRSNSRGGSSTTTTTIFHGLFAKIIMDKSINGELKILRNGSANFDKKQLRMDSSEFEKYFDVSASDKILGMRLLTADVMEELIAFVNKTNMMFDVIIKGNVLYLRFRCGRMFEPSNFKKGHLDQETLRKYFYMLNLTYNLSNKITKTVEEFEV